MMIFGFIKPNYGEKKIGLHSAWYTLLVAKDAEFFQLPSYLIFYVRIHIIQAVLEYLRVRYVSGCEDDPGVPDVSGPKKNRSRFGPGTGGNERVETFWSTDPTWECGNARIVRCWWTHVSWEHAEMFRSGPRSGHLLAYSWYLPCKELLKAIAVFILYSDEYISREIVVDKFN